MTDLARSIFSDLTLKLSGFFRKLIAVVCTRMSRVYNRINLTKKIMPCNNVYNPTI